MRIIDAYVRADKYKQIKEIIEECEQIQLDPYEGRIKKDQAKAVAYEHIKEIISEGDDDRESKSIGSRKGIESDKI